MRTCVFVCPYLWRCERCPAHNAELYQTAAQLALRLKMQSRRLFQFHSLRFGHRPIGFSQVRPQNKLIVYGVRNSVVSPLQNTQLCYVAQSSVSDMESDPNPSSRLTTIPTDNVSLNPTLRQYRRDDHLSERSRYSISRTSRPVHWQQSLA